MITFFTICLDGLPWIATHHAMLCQLKVPWQWIVVEGVANAVADTHWCQRMNPRLSADGTTEYLDGLESAEHRVKILRAPLWPGKAAMCNAALSQIKATQLVWQIDSDEVWTAAKIEAVYKLFEQHPAYNSAYFWCRYFVGPDIAILNRDCYGNHPAYEWKRVWRWRSGLRFATHEPPVLAGVQDRPMPHSLTESVGAVFDHFAYATEAAVRFKQFYYGSENNAVGKLYANAIDGWWAMQRNEKWPTQLKTFMPWVDDKAIVARIDNDSR